METALRPLTLGEILDRTAQLYRQNFLLFAGIAAVYAGAMLALNLLTIGMQELFRAAHMTGALLWLNGIAGMVLWLVIFVLGGVAVAANNRAVAWVHLGEPATIRGAYKSILPRVGRYLWLMVLKTLIPWLPFIAIYGAYIALLAYYTAKGYMTHQDAASRQAMVIFAMATLAFVLLIVPVVVYGTLMALRYALAVPASVVENLKARAAIKRSIELSKGARARIFALWMLVLVIEMGLVTVTQGFFFVEIIKLHHELPVGLRILQQVVAFFTNSFVTPILATGITLFYYDQRVRKEGYDIEWMMQAAGLTPPAPVAEPTAAPPPQEPWLPLDAHFQPPPVPQAPGSEHE